jgi:hypothetical protein
VTCKICLAFGSQTDRLTLLEFGLVRWRDPMIDWEKPISTHLQR